jgi:hypothetical protein
MPVSRTSGDISILYVVLVIFVGGWLLASCPPNGTTYGAENPCSYQDIVAYQQTEKLRAASSFFARRSTKAQETCSPARAADPFCQQIVLGYGEQAKDYERQAYQAWGTISKGCREYIRNARSR